MTVDGESESRKLRAADSYAGIPMVDYDESVNDWVERYAVSRSEVLSNFERFGVLDEHVVFLEGLFNETLATALPERLAIVHADGDAYDSTMDVLKEGWCRKKGQVNRVKQKT